MKKILAFSGLFLCLFSCKKDKNDSNNPSPTNPNDTIKKVDNFTFQYNGAPEISQVQVFNIITQDVGYVFNASSTGIYTLEFHGVGGREVLQGNILNPNYINTAQWDIGNNDTFRIFKNGVKLIDLISDNSNINSGVNIEVPYPGTLPDSIKARVNRFTKHGGIMEGMKFNTL
ncbi:MAG: hypothetical protein QM737_09980 [Ferruginibacter sp.]